MHNYFSHGKLLLTGEYVVLDGALSLAIPTKYGQSLAIEPINEPKLIWTSLDEKGAIWFEAVFNSSNNKIVLVVCNNHNISDRLIQILNSAKQLNPNFLNTDSGFKVTTKLDFPKNWGLGSSSTLINNIAQWARIDAQLLLEQTFGGSGYDIACAQHDKPITYQILNASSDVFSPDGPQDRNVKKRQAIEVDFNPSFKEHLYFIHLNKKQNSREGIKHYNAQKGSYGGVINKISAITSKIMTCNTLHDFETLITQHEQIIAKITKQVPVKALLFKDFAGHIKSLGAWGGDFILVTSKEAPHSYFQSKGYETIISYADMML